MLNNSDAQPFVLKIEPIEANEHRNEFINDKELLITKLQDDLVQEKELNKKYTNEIRYLTVKIDSHKEEEKRLLQTIKEYKAEIDLLSTNLDSCSKNKQFLLQQSRSLKNIQNPKSKKYNSITLLRNGLQTENNSE